MMLSTVHGDRGRLCALGAISVLLCVPLTRKMAGYAVLDIYANIWLLRLCMIRLLLRKLSQARRLDLLASSLTGSCMERSKAQSEAVQLLHKCSQAEGLQKTTSKKHRLLQHCCRTFPHLALTFWLSCFQVYDLVQPSLLLDPPLGCFAALLSRRSMAS